MERDEVKLVDVLPIIEMVKDFDGIVVEQIGVEALVLGRVRSALAEEIVLVHDTDFFD